MAITFAAANFSAVQFGAASTTLGIQLPTDVPTDAAIFLIVHNRTNETAVISGIADGAAANTWTLGTVVRQGPNDHSTVSMRSWVIVLTNAVALSGAANRLVTVTFDGAITSQGAGGWVSSDQGAMTFGNVGTFTDKTANDTTFQTNSVSPAGASGVIIAGGAAANSQGAAPTAGGSDTMLTTHGAGMRVWQQGRVFSSSGTYDCSATLAANSATNNHILYLDEPGGAALSIVPTLIQNYRNMGIMQ